MYEGKVLDGRNRATACERLGVQPKTVEYTGNDPLAFVLSKNLHRRHLTTSQRAMVAAKIEQFRHGGDRKNQDAKLRLGREKTAKSLNVSSRSVNDAAKVQKSAVPEVAEAVEAGKMPVSAAAKLADAPPEEQREIVAQKDKKAIMAEVREKKSKNSTTSSPRRKTVAKEPEPEQKPTKRDDQVWLQEGKKMCDWWDKMPQAYRQLTDGEDMTGCMMIPVPFHHNMMMAMFRQMFADMSDEVREEVRSKLISEVNLLAKRIDELCEEKLEDMS
jgi:hypothetical protein